MQIKTFYKVAKYRLFNICRSITGDGVRKTLNIYKEFFPDLKIRKIPCGKKVFDWVIPPEWNIKDAYVIDKNGKKIIEFKKNNLHIVNYSIPINKLISKQKFLNHIHSLPKQPDAIPYVTSYYKKIWGFCITDKQKKRIIKFYNNKDKFKVVIKSKFKNNGNLNYGEILIKGKSKKEILISTYICHPSMANNELSGSIVALSLISHFKRKRINKSLRFIFIPETIGSVAYISTNFKKLKKFTIGGYNLSCIGDEKSYSCILSKYQNSIIDNALIESYKKLKIRYKKYSFLQRGSDERQFNSPGVDIPVATICRSKFFEYPEYHTSLDNFNIVTLKGLRGGFSVVKKAINILQKKIIPESRILCEPKLSKRGLHHDLSIKSNYGYKSMRKNLLSFIQYSDGKNDIEDIQKLLKISKKETLKLFFICKKNNLLK
tara:strand:+ start:4298 stop:5593 length:1296 start_codon:yes stop_codon:yes gene_type:complete